MDAEKHDNVENCNFSSSRINARALHTSLLSIALIIIIAVSSSASVECMPYDPRSQQLQHSHLQGSRPRQRQLASTQCQQQTCGNMSIPYPFGLSPECARDRFFELQCNHTLGIDNTGGSEMGYWPFLTNVAVGAAVGTQWDVASQTSSLYNYSTSSFQVLSIIGNTLVIETTKIKAMDCGGSNGTASIRVPFYSPYEMSAHNILTAVGCGYQMKYADGTGYSGNCGSQSLICNEQGSSAYLFCGHYDCCTIPVAPSAEFHLTGGGRPPSLSSSTCAYGSLLFPASFHFQPAFGGEFGRWTYGTELLYHLDVPTNLTIDDNVCNDPPVSLMESPDYACTPYLAKCTYVRTPEESGYYCTCNNGSVGDGYKMGSGCVDIDECMDASLHNCDREAMCLNLQGTYSCQCPSGSSGDGFRNGTGCRQIPSNTTPIIIGSVVGGSSLLLVCLAVLIVICRLESKKVAVEKEKLLLLAELGKGIVKPPTFSYSDLKTATNNFRESLGQGGFGVVYKGKLRDGTAIAVKQLLKREQTVHRSSAQKQTKNQKEEEKRVRKEKEEQDSRDFVNEVVAITGIKHKNLAQLIGCCIENGERILVYEFVENGNLETCGIWRENETLRGIVDWRLRFEICLGIARGLSYLHNELPRTIVHRDIKPANVLLDRNLEAKIADFGLAKLFPDENTQVQTVNVAGSRGYMPPEYVNEGTVSAKLDVYSFGIIVLEIICGRRYNDKRLDPSFDGNYVRAWAKKLQKARTLMKFLDPSLRPSSPPEAEVERVINIGLMCVENNPDHRPTMSEVVTMLLQEQESTYDRLILTAHTNINEADKFLKAAFEDSLLEASSSHVQAHGDEIPLLDMEDSMSQWSALHSGAREVSTGRSTNSNTDYQRDISGR